jgi:hypothetical protein
MAGSLASALAAVLLSGCSTPAPPHLQELEPGVAYANRRGGWLPLSIHVVRLDRSQSDFELHSTHARGTALGLATLTEQIESMDPALGRPVVGVNGDFFQVAGQPYAGDPRGLQISEGELLSAPTGKVVFWIGADGQPYATNVVPHFEVTWPDGTTSPFGLNEKRRTNNLVLYTPAMGGSTQTGSGRELILERVEQSAWLPLRLNETLTARVRRVRGSGDARLSPETMILSIDPVQTNCLPEVQVGAVLHLSLTTRPDLDGTKTAVGGGPLLVQNGKALSPPKPKHKGRLPYEFQSMRQRHPRVAVGWNDRYYFLVVVDGRQRVFSRGMTLKELARFMVSLGCREALNFDGGGSATLWVDGQVVNSPSDGWEREVANALVVVKKVTGQCGTDGSDPSAD